MTVENQVLRARAALRMTQSKFAEAMGVSSYMTVLSWEKGRRHMNSMNRERLRQLMVSEGLDFPPDKAENEKE